jgi:hypothetical protein
MEATSKLGGELKEEGVNYMEMFLKKRRIMVIHIISHL